MNNKPVAKKSYRVKFSHSSPPSCVMEAKKRLDTLERFMSVIRGQFESKTEREFGTPDQYDIWKNRATKVLSLMNNERNFVRDWLRHLPQLSAISQVKTEKKPSEEELEKERKIRKMVDSFFTAAPPYEPIYTEKVKPTSLGEIRARKVAIQFIQDYYVRFLRELQNESLRLDFSTPEYFAERRRVGHKVYEMENELKSLNLAKKGLTVGQKLAVVPSTEKVPVEQTETVQAIQQEIEDLKAKLGMRSASMCSFLHSIVTRNCANLKITEEESKTIEGIGRYIETVARHRALSSYRD